MKIRDFNRDWEFHSDKSAEVQIVNLPHDAMIMENRDKSNPSGGACAYFDGGKYSYKKKFKEYHGMSPAKYRKLNRLQN